MKAFVGVLGVLLLLFGASIIYFRGDFNVGGKTSNKVISNKGNESNDQKKEVNQAPTITSNPAPVVVSKYTTLEIRQNKLGSAKIGETRIYTAVAKDETGAVVTVDAQWSLAKPSLGSLSLASGPETKFVAQTSGKGKILASFKDLKAEKEVEVGAGAVAGVTTGVPVTSATQTSSTTVYAVGTTAQSTEIKPYAIYLYDPSGNRFNIGESRTFTSQVQYVDNNVKTPELIWSVEPSDLGTLDKTKGSSVIFKASRSGSGNLKATFENLSASLYIQVN